VRLSILILSWNTRELTLEALASIAAHPPSDSYEVVVVDNGSHDGSADAIAARHPEVTLVRSPDNLGYGPGNNLAFRHSRGDAVLLLGSDTIVRPGALDTLIRCLDEEPAAGAVTCRLEGPTGYPERACLDFPTVRDGAALYLSQPRFARHLPGDRFDFERRQSVAQASGTCLLLRREVVEQVGLFDEAYKILYTDVELCHRIHDAGWDIVYTPDAVVMHLGHRSSEQATGPLRAQMYQDILRYYVTRFGSRAAVVLLPILLVRLSLLTRGRHLGALLRPRALRASTGVDFGGTARTPRRPS
jgi:GT2 family glycosyltransferase